MHSKAENIIVWSNILAYYFMIQGLSGTKVDLSVIPFFKLKCMLI